MQPDEFGLRWMEVQETLLSETSTMAQKDMAHWTIAEFVRKHLHRYNKPVYPRRPGNIADDEAILRVLEKRGKRNAAELHTLNYFTAWRMAFWRQETEAISRVKMLLSAAATMNRIGIPESRDELLRHLEDQFDFKGAEAPTDYLEREELSRRLCVDLVQLPGDLRSGERRVEQDTHPEDDMSFFEKLDKEGK